ncbi:hypothetical protein TCELL_1048 [Thermogladius calderae 1633]|uniref:Uncharacterized protein n=1 Tax=Thermogladius calderae (strain DSM 22663 / VKM B-2946 / 1633) TaxID=1184251 RepID=I3TFD3_THEC1|nr:hypothetical protein [Thermogladius calderae]AFK51471.1 hypothetical protein TCELL_1048 [Thermogladius calderae 1633]
MCSGKKLNRLLAALELALLASFFAVPYTLLAGSRGLELLAYWTLATVAAGLLALLHLELEAGEEG